MKHVVYVCELLIWLCTASMLAKVMLIYLFFAPRLEQVCELHWAGLLSFMSLARGLGLACWTFEPCAPSFLSNLICWFQTQIPLSFCLYLANSLATWCTWVWVTTGHALVHPGLWSLTSAVARPGPQQTGSSGGSWATKLQPWRRWRAATLDSTTFGSEVQRLEPTVLFSSNPYRRRAPQVQCRGAAREGATTCPLLMSLQPHHRWIAGLIRVNPRWGTRANEPSTTYGALLQQWKHIVSVRKKTVLLLFVTSFLYLPPRHHLFYLSFFLSYLFIYLFSFWRNNTLQQWSLHSNIILQLHVILTLLYLCMQLIWFIKYGFSVTKVSLLW